MLLRLRAIEIQSRYFLEGLANRGKPASLTALTQAPLVGNAYLMGMFSAESLIKLIFCSSVSFWTCIACGSEESMISKAHLSYPCFQH